MSLPQMRPFDNIAELNRVMGQCQNILRTDKPRMMDAFDELSKILFAKILDEVEVLKGIKKYPHLYYNSEKIHSIKRKTDSLFKEAISYYPGIFDRNEIIELRTTTIANIVKLISGYSILNTPIDIKGATYESFLKSSFPVGKIIGQFFTPLKIVDFISSFLKPSYKDTILDLACGSGGFLLGSARYVFDDCINKEINNNAIDQISYLNNKLFGIDIDSRMVRLTKMNLLIHALTYSLDIEEFNQIITGNGLLYNESLHSLSENSMDIIVTNPPFGGIESDHNILRFFQLGQNKKSRSLPILFLERCIQLLKPGGKLAIILPDSILNGSSNKDARKLVKKLGNISAVIKLPPETFLPYGSTALSSILVVEKKDEKNKQGPIFMAIANYVGYNGKGENIVDNELPLINNVYENNKTTLQMKHPDQIIFYVSENEILERLDVNSYYHPEFDKILNILARSKYPVKSLRSLVYVKKRRIINPIKEDPFEMYTNIGLGDIESKTGIILKVNEELGKNLISSYQKVEKGDILYAKLRPYLKKCIFVESKKRNLICSSEFLILRPLKNISGKYLSFLLRTDLAGNQLKHLYTGVGRPRVSKKDLLEVKIPIPNNIEDQISIFEEGKKFELKSISHKKEAKSLLEKSEKILLERDELLFKLILK